MVTLACVKLIAQREETKELRVTRGMRGPSPSLLRWSLLVRAFGGANTMREADCPMRGSERVTRDERDERSVPLSATWLAVYHAIGRLDAFHSARG